MMIITVMTLPAVPSFSPSTFVTKAHSKAPHVGMLTAAAAVEINLQIYFPFRERHSDRKLHGLPSTTNPPLHPGPNFPPQSLENGRKTGRIYWAFQSKIWQWDTTLAQRLATLVLLCSAAARVVSINVSNIERWRLMLGTASESLPPRRGTRIRIPATTKSTVLEITRSYSSCFYFGSNILMAVDKLSYTGLCLPRYFLLSLAVA